MEKNSKILVCGSRGLVGSGFVRRLRGLGYSSLLVPTSLELDLTDQNAVERFFNRERPTHVILAAAKVGGILANRSHPAQFCYTNLAIQNNVIHTSYKSGVTKLLFLGSSCVYPKNAKVPIKEESLLTGELESTNEGYAVAKIAGLKLCEYYRTEYGCNFISMMPTNTFGPNDNYDLESSHVIPALIRKFHEAALRGDQLVMVWGSGKPRREIIYVDDVVDAGLFLMSQYSGVQHINVGTGVDHSILEIAEMIKSVVGFRGEIAFDTTKPDGVFRKVMDVSKITRMGWSPQVSIMKGLELAYQDFRQQLR